MKRKAYDSVSAFSVHLSDLLDDHERTDTLRALVSAYFVSTCVQKKQLASEIKSESQIVAQTLDGLTRSPYLHAETFGYHNVGNGQVAHVKPVAAFGRDPSAAGT